MKSNDKRIFQTLAGIMCCLIVLVVIAGIYEKNNIKKTSQKDITALVDTTKEFVYLSDVPYNKEESFVGWGSITLDRNLESRYNNGLITLNVDGSPRSFIKGISAHATSEVVFDITDLDYDYFSTYYGVDASRGTNGNGVKFYIYTSANGTDWVLRTPETPEIKKGDSEADHISIDLAGQNYIKLSCNNLNNATADHCAYGNAKLYKEGYNEAEDDKPYSFIKTIEEYDNILNNVTYQELITTKEHTLLQRKFVSSFGYDLLQSYAHLDSNYKATIEWIMTDKEALKYYVTGGRPTGTYINSLSVLNKLYTEYKDDLTVSAETEYTSLSDLYKRMMISLSLTHSANVCLWVGGGQCSDAVVRYEIYKRMRDEELLYNKVFETLNIEEMRWVMNNNIDDEEIEWLNNYIRKNNMNTDPYHYITYRFGYNYSLPKYYDNTSAEYSAWDQKYELSRYNITCQTGKPKLWIVFEQGSVCGGLSKTGSNINGAFGNPSAVIGQPGHAAYLQYSETTDGKGMWAIYNNVGGWTVAEKSERMLAGWGSNNWDSYYQVSYTPYAQEALNDIENYNKALETMLIADLYQDNAQKLEEIYRKALSYQSINMDAWYGLIQAYNRNENKTALDYMNLAKELADNMYAYPLPMFDLMNLIKPKLNGTVYLATFTNYLKASLEKGSQLGTGIETDVLQPAISRVMANYLLGKDDYSIATFSFDGPDANKIMLGTKYEGNGVRWDYSLDGGVTWTATSDNYVLLSTTELKKVNVEKDIKIHIVGVNYDPENIYTIDITKGVLPRIDNHDYLYGNDLENRVVGVDLTYEWRMEGTNTWTSYSKSSPNLTGNKTVEIRIGATKTQLPSDTAKYTFTEDTDTDTRKYVPVSYLSINSVSSQATSGSQRGHATNAIDGNYNTRWHSAWNGSDTSKYIVIELEKEISLSAFEYVPADGGNGRILEVKLLGSTDGENFEEIAHTTWANNMDTKTIEFDTDKPVVKYIKLVGVRTSTAGGGNFIAARMFNIYQDITDSPHPTAGISYSTTEATTGNVVARLINPSREITITNNYGSDTYTFADNGEFTFEFVDKKGQTGSATARVTWIDKKIPTADIEYNLDNDRKLVILLDNISEDVYILDKNNNPIHYVEVENGKAKYITYLDANKNVYKTLELDENGRTSRIIYENTTNDVENVKTYVVTLNSLGEVTNEDFLDEAEALVTITDGEKAKLRALHQTGRSNPLEYTFDKSGEYTFKFQDKASNIAYKSIKVDYTDNGRKIIASDITFDITSLTNKDVVATINPYIIDENNIKKAALIVDGEKEYTFTENGTFTFKYKDEADTQNFDVKEHTTKVDWIDKIAPTAGLKYDRSSKTKAVVTIVNPSEYIDFLGETGVYEYTENGTYTIYFADRAGNLGKVIAYIDWLETKKDDDSNKPNNPDNNNNNNNSNTNQGNINKPNYPNKRPIVNIDIKPNTEVKYKKYSAKNITLEIPESYAEKVVNLNINYLKMNAKLKKDFDANSEYIELYLKDTNGEKIVVNTDEFMNLNIDLNSSKKFVGIYEVKDDGTVDALSYELVNDNKIAVKVNSLGKYLLSYKEKVVDNDKTVNEPSNVVNNEVNNNHIYLWYVLGASLVVGLVVIVVVKKKNK